MICASKKSTSFPARWKLRIQFYSFSFLLQYILIFASAIAFVFHIMCVFATAFEIEFVFVFLILQKCTSPLPVRSQLDFVLSFKDPPYSHSREKKISLIFSSHADWWRLSIVGQLAASYVVRKIRLILISSCSWFAFWF